MKTSESPNQFRRFATFGFVLSLFTTTFVHADTLYVTSAGNNLIMRYTAPGVGSVFASGGLMDHPNGLAFDRTGNLFVGNYHGGNILKFTPDGLGSIFAVGVSSTPYGMAFDTSGNLYVADVINNSIRKFTPGGVRSTFASGLDYPVGIAFDAAGNLFAANYFGNSITMITPGGSKSTFANTGLNGPEGLAFDTSGNLYVANSANHAHGAAYIERFTPGGVGSLFVGGIYDPQGLAFDNAGNLFATSRGDSNSILQITPGGGVSTYATGGLDTPAFMTMQPVPEPSVAALVVAPFGLFAFRRAVYLPCHACGAKSQEYGTERR